MVSERFELARNVATVASAAIAVCALFRPELARFFARFLGRVSLHPSTGFLEIGYSSTGASVAVDMVVRSSGVDFFIAEIQSICRRSADGMTRTLAWTAFRPPAFPGTQLAPSDLKPAAGFYLEPKGPNHLVVFFADSISQKAIRALLEPQAKVWRERALRIREGLGEATTANDVELRAALVREWQAFSESQGFIQTNEAIKQEFVWRPGSYELVIRATTADPTRSFETRLAFELTKTDTDLLLANSVVLLRHACGFGDWFLNFARVEFVAKA